MSSPHGPRAAHHVLIVDDDPAMESEAVEAVQIFPDATIRTARTMGEAERWIKRVRFDLAIVDLGLPDGSGIDLIRTLTAGAPPEADVRDVPTVCVARTVFDDDAHLFAALSAGAHGYLLKGEPLEIVRGRLTAAMAGEPVVSPAIARRVLAFFRGEVIQLRTPHPARAVSQSATLTTRETEVLRHLAQGQTLGEVARDLALSINTVKTHVKNVYARLDVTTRVGAVDAARRMGLLDDDGR